MTNHASETQNFFSAVATGSLEQFIPNKQWSPLKLFNASQCAFKKVYDKFKGNFDLHIATSIPTFRENQIVVGTAIVGNLPFGLMYDIGGSEGGFCKAITDFSFGTIQTINLDPNEEMEAIHNATPIYGSTYVKEAFYEGFEYNGVNYKTHVPKRKADIVHESMTFQFITKDREAFVKEIKDNYLKPDGIFITEQKFSSRPDLYDRAEVIKNAYKRQYYTPEQLATKDESIVVGMKENQADSIEFLRLLQDNFKHVGLHWVAGNFLGFMATDSDTTFKKYNRILTLFNEADLTV